MNNANLSIITAIEPKRLSKGYSLGIDGDLLKAPGGNLIRGKIEARTISTLLDLAATLQGLTPAQALVYGVPINSASRVMTRKAFSDAGRPEGATTRTNDDFRWPHGAGVMMLDYDPTVGGDALDRDSLVQAIRAAVPGLVASQMLWWPSASSCIWAGEKELNGIKGQRIYLLVQEATDIPRAGKALVARLWLASFGQIEVSKSGALLERTLVDASVWQASRLDFAGGANCGAGLEQRRGDPVVIDGDAMPIDSRVALPDLTAQESDKLAAIKAEAKWAAQPKAKSVSATWIDARVQEMVAPEDQGDPERTNEARRIAHNALDTGVLAGDFILQLQTAFDKVEAVTVACLMDDRERWHGCLTRDPLEPDYDGARFVGRLFLMQARPTLHSFAHGGKTYRLHRAPARIELVEGHTAESATTAIELLRRDPVTFDFGGQLALAEGGRVHPLCEHALSYHLASVAQFWKRSKKGNLLVSMDSDPPPALLKQIIAQGDRRNLKSLFGVITGPTIRLDGSVLSAPGYDKITRLMLDPLGEEVPDVQTCPTLDQAKAALDTLLHPFQSFPFVDANAKGALLAAILTAAIRPVLPTSPAIAFDAPIQGSGKTLLASCIGAIAEGREPAVWPHTQGRDDEETRKRLFTALRTGGKALIWDNITGAFDSASMAAFITADAMVDRVLGKSEAIRIPNRALLILTGNNLSLAGDLPRRVIICRIDPETDQPFARQFDLDPLQWVLENRMAMLAAACTLIRSRFTHFTKPALGRLASFEAWDDLVRQTVVFSDIILCPSEFGDPMDLVREAQAADPEADALFALLDALRERFRGAQFNAKEAMAAMQSDMGNRAIETALLDLAGDRAVRSAKSIGRVLKHREGRIVHGLRLTGRADAASGSRFYRVQSMDLPENGFNGFNGFDSSHMEKELVPF